MRAKSQQVGGNVETLGWDGSESQGPGTRPHDDSNVQIKLESE